MCFQLCIPPQQISPSAARRSPCCSAMSQASAEGLGDRFLAFGGFRRPLVHAGRRIDPDDAGLANPDFAELPRDAAGLLDHRQELLALVRRSHSRTAADRRPYRRDHRADREAMAADLVGEALDVVLGGIDRCVRIGEKQVDAFELGPAGAGGGGQPPAWCRGRWAAPNPVPCPRDRATWRCAVSGKCCPTRVPPVSRFGSWPDRISPAPSLLAC